MSDIHFNAAATRANDLIQTRSEKRKSIIEQYSPQAATNGKSKSEGLTPEAQRALLRQMLQEAQSRPSKIFAAVHQRFEAQVEERPDALAIVTEQEQLTYRELNERANQVAHHLLGLGLGRESNIALHAAPSSALVIGLLGILKSGGTAILLDPSMPRQQLEQIIAVTNTTAVVTQENFISGWHKQIEGSHRQNFQIVTLATNSTLFTQPEVENPVGEIAEHQPACILSAFDHSISLTHGALSKWLARLNSQFTFTPSDRFLQNASLGQPSVLVQIFAPLLSGGQLIAGQIDDSAQATHLSEHYGATVAWWMDEMDPRAEVATLRLLFSEGRPMASALVKYMESIAPQVRCYTLYSLPEVGGLVALQQCLSKTEAIFPATIQPIYPQATLHILDERLQTVPQGIRGALYIGSDDIAPAYIGDRQRTKRAFVQNPFVKDEQQRLFRTGYRARRKNDGTLELWGTLKRQVWVNGICLNLETIEAALLQEPSVQACTILPRETASGALRLVAYLVIPSRFNPDTLEAHIRNSLPVYMQPISYVRVATLPLTDAGLIDESALHSLDIIDAHLMQDWETSIQAIPDVDQVAVVSRNSSTEKTYSHLADLLLHWQASTQSDDQGYQAENRKSSPPMLANDEPKPAISQGPSLIQSPNGAKTLADMLQRAVAQTPAHGLTFIQSDENICMLSYRDLLAQAERVLGGLRGLGLKPKDKVIFQLETNEDFIVAFWGCVLGGFVPVPIAVASSYERENSTVSKLVHAWQMLDRPLIITDPKHAPEIASLAPLLSTAGLNVATIDDLRASTPDSVWYPAQPDEMAVMMLTSGSTGMPKGVMLSHANVISRSSASQQMNHFTSAEISLNWMPLDHVAGIIYFHLRDLFLGCHQIQVANKWILQDPLRWLDLIHHYRATITFAPNFAYGMVNDRVAEMERKTWDLSTMHTILNGAEAIVARTARRFLDLLHPYGLDRTAMVPAWGMSETSSGVTYAHNFSLATTTDDDKFVNVGKPLSGVALRIVDDENNLLSEGEIGRLQANGLTVMQGYYNDPKRNAEAFTDDGWFDTGDLAFLQSGSLTITGRAKDEIIIRGINYYCHELEAAVEEVPGVDVSFTAACTVHESGSSVDKAAIFFCMEAGEHQQPDAYLQTLLQSIRQQVIQLTGLNPDYIIPVQQAEIPKTELGKIQHAKLKTQFEAGTFQTQLKQIDLFQKNANTLPDWFFELVWSPQSPTSQSAYVQGQNYLVFMDEAGLGDFLCAELTQRARGVVQVQRGMDFARIDEHRYEINPAEPTHYRQLLQTLIEDDFAADHIVHLWTYAAEDDAQNGQLSQIEHDLIHRQTPGLFSLLYLAQSVQPMQDTSVRLHVASYQAQVIHPENSAEVTLPEKATLLGLLKTITQEMAQLTCHHINFSMLDSAITGPQLLSELSEHQPPAEVAYSSGQRLVPRLQQADLASAEKMPLPFKPGGIYLVSGGLGGIGTEIARHLLSQYQARLLLVGRTPLPDEGTWPTLLPDDEAYSQVMAYQALRLLGGDILYVPTDICDAGQVADAVAQAQSCWGGHLDGIIHLAGSFHECPLAEETTENFLATLAPKVIGTQVLYELIKDDPQAFFIHTSSVNGFFGGASVGAYAAANSFVDAFARYQSHVSAVKNFAFAWSMWDETGISRGYAAKSLTRTRGYYTISPTEGIHALLAGLHYSQPLLFIGLDQQNGYIRSVLADHEYRSQKLAAYFTTSSGSMPMAQLTNLAITDAFGTPSQCDFLQLDEMPLEASGEISRDKLAIVDARTLNGAIADGSPRTDIEQQLATIWQELLRVSQIGIHDNFFALGGDSILSIQAIARANAVGLHLTPKLLFQHQTIAELAAVVEPTTIVSAEQGTMTGAVDLIPIQHWFFEQEPAQAHHFNMSILLQVPKDADASIIAQSLAHLMAHHDALRLQFTPNGNSWQQAFGPVETPSFQVFDLTQLPPEEQPARIEAHGAELQASLDLEQGPMLQTAYFDLGQGRPGRLLLVLHHLIVDGVSWRILLADLMTLYEQLRHGVDPLLPPKTTSFKAWSEQLHTYAQHASLAVELETWLAQPWHDVVPLPVDHDVDPGANSVASTAQITFSLDIAETRALLQDVPTVYNARINDILLAALTESIAKWTGIPIALIDLEGHGRADIFEKVDLSRTVGWLTTLYPVVLRYLTREDISKDKRITDEAEETEWALYLRSIKEQLQQIPNGGIGYGLLRYLHEDSEVRSRFTSLPRPEISFNYLGQFDQVFADTGGWQPAAESSGPERSPSSLRPHLFEVTGMVTQGQLHFTWTYSQHIHTTETVERLAQQMAEALRSLIQQSKIVEAGSYIPSDFPLAQIEQPTLDQITQQVGRIEDIYPLSPLQQGLIFHTLYTPHASAYCEQVTFLFRGRLDIEAFQQAWSQIIAAHSILRTSFILNTESPLQVVHPMISLPWTEEDMRALPVADQNIYIEDFLQQEQKRGFDLEQAPLFRLALLQTGDDTYNFVFSHHHALLDGWSLPILFQQLFAAYEAFTHGETVSIEATRPFRDYIAWLQSQDSVDGSIFWTSHLHDFDTPTVLRTPQADALQRQNREDDGPATQNDGEMSFAQAEIALPAATTAALHTLTQQHGLTLNTLIQGSWALLLSRYSGENDIVFGTVVSGRPPELAGMERMVGLFINTLPVRVKLENSLLLPWLHELHLQQTEREGYAYTPLNDIQKLSAVPQGTALFETLIAFENYPIDESIQTDDGREADQLEIESASIVEQTHYPLTLIVIPGETLQLRVHYDTSRFGCSTAQRILQNLQTLLTEIALSPKRRVFDLPMASRTERAQILDEWNDTATDYPRTQTIHQLFEAQAAASPDDVALIFGEEQLTYENLNIRANRLAHTLRKLGVGPDVLVGLYVERSLEMVVSTLAILKAGGAYLPFDQSYPPERLTFMLDDADVNIILTQQKFAIQMPENSARIIVIDENLVAEQQRAKTIIEAEYSNPAHVNNAQDLAYVMYTSGSTGIPKGVSIAHQSVVRLVRETNYITFTTEDVFLQLAPTSFDAATLEIWGPLLNGARLVIMPPHMPSLTEIGAAIRRHGVSVLWLTSGLFRLMADNQLADLATVRQLLAGGDVLPVPQVEKVLTQPGKRTLINGYGPTENTTFACCYPMTDPAQVTRTVPIGRPIANTQTYILDQHQQLCPVGVAGELYIGGDGLAREYLGRPALNAERFISLPIQDDAKQTSPVRLYRTGDLVRYMPTGDIEFIGRMDTQVKVRGFRIELGEIESALAAHENVRAAVVTAHEDQPGRKQLVAYVVLDVPIQTDSLQGYLYSQLPEYMVPAIYIPLEALPLTPNGKVDRGALPAPDMAVSSMEELYEMPRNRTEKVLADVWAYVMGLDEFNVGIHKNFFDAGGDSILSIQIVARSRQHGIQISPKQIFEHQTIAELASVAGTTTPISAEQGVVTGAVPLTAIQHWLFSQALAAPHHYNQSVLVEVDPNIDLDALAQTMAHLIQHHDALRLCFTQEEGIWQQRYGDIELESSLARIDLSHLHVDEQFAALEAEATKIQASFSLATGPLFQPVCFEFGAGQPYRLLFATHHLVVDAVSWRILLADLALGYDQAHQGKAIYLPPKSTSFQEWAIRINRYAQSESMKAEMAYWTTTLAGDIPALPVDISADLTLNLESTASQVSVRLAADQTRVLLNDVPAVYNTQINDVLMAALAQSFTPWTRSRQLLVNIEGHGRENIFEDIDLSRTVGWFTTIYPVRIELPNVDHPGTLLTHVKEQLRAIPERGMGYGLLHYLAEDPAIRAQMAALPQAEVSFNYLGQLDGMMKDGLWQPAGESSGPGRDMASQRSHLLEISGFVAEGKLHIDCAYCPKIHHRETIEKLTERFVTALESIIDHCQSAEESAFTPSDFPLANLNMNKLDKLAGLLEQIDDTADETINKTGVS